MGKNKLRKFAEMETFPNVFQFTCRTMGDNALGTTRPASSNSTQQADNDTPSPHPMAGHWRDTFFHNDHPIVLELGCGRGDYTVGLAAAHPERNYIGIDIKGARMWAGARQAVQQGMTNVAFLRTNIEIINLFFAPCEVDEIWITFPDPQMKKVTKRLTSTWFMARYARLLRPDGRIHLKTDSPFLYTYTRAMLQTNQLPVLADTDNLYGYAHCGDDAMLGDDAARVVTSALTEATMLQTHYEHQWLDRGMTIKYLCWQLFNVHCALTEPDIEIEHDTYRSYGRNYESN